MNFEKHETGLLWTIEQAGENSFRARKRTVYLNLVAGLGFLALWMFGGRTDELAYQAWLGALWLMASFYESRLLKRDRVTLKLSQRLRQEGVSWMVDGSG